jgi:DNA-binding IclR family transcriptional regulator
MTGEIRTAGYATSWSELEENFAAVAAPILNPGGIVCGAVCVGGPVRRLQQERLDLVGRRLRVAAQSLGA